MGAEKEEEEVADGRGKGSRGKEVAGDMAWKGGSSSDKNVYRCLHVNIISDMLTNSKIVTYLRATIMFSSWYSLKYRHE